MAHHLSRLYREQLAAFGATPRFRGSFFWTLRMGSGWEPRPSESYPYGRQLEGSSAWRSLRGYPYAVWSLLEMAAAGIATPLNASSTRAVAGITVAEAEKSRRAPLVLELGGLVL